MADSRAMAQRMIREGRVGVGGVLQPKPATMVDSGTAIELIGSMARYVSRGGEKLEHALVEFGVDVTGRRGLDLGASTGGFTDCLLQRGAAEVTAVDVGYGQLDYRLRTDPRVTVVERTNARTLAPGSLGAAFDVVVADLSFISLEPIMPVIRSEAAVDSDVIILVKPQFEVGKDQVSRGGVVTDPRLWRLAIDRVAAAGREHGLEPQDVIVSPLAGASAGNREFLMHLQMGSGGLDTERIEAALLAAEHVGMGGSTP